MGCAAWDFLKKTSTTILFGVKCRKAQVGLGDGSVLHNLPLTN